MPSVLVLLVQLTFPVPPATEYLPKDVFLGFSTLSLLSMLTKGLIGVLRYIPPVTSQAFFGRAKIAANFGLD